jgi:hypothetical protein
MFEDLFDGISFLWSWRWPTVKGEITEAITERIGTGRHEKYRLAIAYKFTLGNDGPYSGESFWSPAFLQKRRVIAARRKFRPRQRVTVHYRRDDPSINRLDRSVWRGL